MCIYILIKIKKEIIKRNKLKPCNECNFAMDYKPIF